MPEESPLEVTKEVVDSKTDLKGVKHGSLSERIRIDLEQLKKDQVENNPLHNTVVTKNGTIVYDYSKNHKHYLILKIFIVSVIQLLEVYMLVKTLGNFSRKIKC